MSVEQLQSKLIKPPHELMIKVCFPEDIGPVQHDDLNTFLRDVQKIDDLQCVKCTLGARVYGKRDTGCSDQVDSGEGRSDVGVTLSSLGYYCKTAAPFHLCKGKDTLIPAIIVELFFSYDINTLKKENVVKGIKECLQQSKILVDREDKSLAVNINIVTFLLFKD